MTLEPEQVSTCDRKAIEKMYSVHSFRRSAFFLPDGDSEMETLRINGVEKEFPVGQVPETIAKLLEQLGINTATVVAEIDGEIVEREKFVETPLILNVSISLSPSGKKKALLRKECTEYIFVVPRMSTAHDDFAGTFVNHFPTYFRVIVA